MKMTGSRDVMAPQGEVWAALRSPEVLKDCVPGCSEMTGSPEEGFEAVVVQKVGPVKATFKGAVTLSEVNEPHSVKLTGQGKGGAAGFATGEADVRLSPIPGGTRLDYEVQAKVGGKLAQLGGRIIDAFGKKMADNFFDCFKAQVEPEGAESPEGEAVTASNAASPAAVAGTAGAAAQANTGGASTDAAVDHATARPQGQSERPRPAPEGGSAPQGTATPDLDQEPSAAKAQNPTPTHTEGAEAKAKGEEPKKKGWIKRLLD